MLKIQQLKRDDKLSSSPGSVKSNQAKNKDIEAVGGNATAQKHLFHSKLPQVSTHSQIELNRGPVPTLEDAYQPQFAIQPEQGKDMYLVTSNTAAPMDSLSPTFANQSASSKAKNGKRHDSKLEIKADNLFKTNEFLKVDKIQTEFIKNHEIPGDEPKNLSKSGKQFVSPPTTSNFNDSSPTQFYGSPTLIQKNRRESMNSILTPVAMNPRMPHVMTAEKRDIFPDVNIRNLQVDSIPAVRHEKPNHKTTIKDLTVDSRNSPKPPYQISFDKTHTTNMAPVEQTTKGSFDRNDETLIKLQNPNIAQITQYGPGQIMVQYRQLQLQNFAKQAVFSPELIVGQKIEQEPKKDTGKIKHGLTAMTIKRNKASRSPKNQDLPHLIPLRMNLSRSNSKDGAESFLMQQSFDQSSTQRLQTESNSPPKRNDRFKQVHLPPMKSPRAEELDIVIGTRVILSQPKSRGDEEIHTDAGSNHVERKESPASNIKRLQRQSLAIVESQENIMMAKEAYTPTSPNYAGFTPHTPQRFEGKFGPNALAESNFGEADAGQASLSDNVGIGTEHNNLEGKNSQFHVESSQDASPLNQNIKLSSVSRNQPQVQGNKSNEFAMLDEGDKALLDIEGSPKMVQESDGQYQIAGIVDPPQQILSHQKAHENGKDSTLLLQNQNKANHTFINQVPNELDVDSSVKIVSSRKDLDITKEYSEVTAQSMHAQQQLAFSGNVSYVNSGPNPGTPYNPFHEEKIRVQSGVSPDDTDRRLPKRQVSPRRKQIILKATSISSSQALGQPAMQQIQNKTEAVSLEKTEWKQLKANASGNIDFKPESGLSHHQANTAPRISVLEAKLGRDGQNSKVSVQITSSSNVSKSGSKAQLDKNKSGTMPLKKILGIEQKTGNVKIASSSRMSKSPTRHAFHAHSLIELGRRSLNDSGESLQSMSPGETLSPEHGKDFFLNKDLKKFNEFKKRKDFSGFIHKDTAWMQEKGDDGKVVCPSYSHVWERKVPAKPIYGRIYRKVAQQYNKTRQRSKPKHVNTQMFTTDRHNHTGIASDIPKFLSSKDHSVFFQQTPHINNSQSSASNLSQTEQQEPTRGSRISSTDILAHDSALQRNVGVASSELNSLLHQKQMLEQYMLSNNSSPGFHRLITFENSAKSLYGYGSVAESQMEESRNHSLFDKSNNNISPAPTDGIAADKNYIKIAQPSVNGSGPTSMNKSSKLNLHENEDPSSFNGDKQNQQAVLEMVPGGSFAILPSCTDSQQKLTPMNVGQIEEITKSKADKKDDKKQTKNIKPTKQRSIRKIQITTQNYTKIDDIIAQAPEEHSSHIGTQNSLMTSQTPFAPKSTQPSNQVNTAARVTQQNDKEIFSRNDSNAIPGESSTFMPIPNVKGTHQTQYNQLTQQQREFVKEGGQDLDPSLQIKKIGTPGSHKSLSFQVDIKVPSQKSSQYMFKQAGDGQPTDRSNAKDHAKMGTVNSISYNAEALKNMASQFQFKKNKRVFLGEKPFLSKQEMYGDKTKFLSQGMRDSNRKSFVEQNQVLLGGHKDLQKRPGNINAAFGKAGDKSHSLHSSRQDLGQRFQFQQKNSAYSIEGAKLSISGQSPREGQRAPELVITPKELQNATAHQMNFQPLNVAQQQRLLQQSQLLKQTRSPHSNLSPFDAVERASKEGLDVQSASVHSSVLQQISELGRQFVAVGQTPDYANRSNQSSSPAMKQLHQQSLQTATQPRRSRKKKTKQHSLVQPLLNMSQVLNEINHSIKSPSKRSPEKHQNMSGKNQDLSRYAKKLIGRSTQKSSAFIPNASDVSLFGIETPNMLPKNLKSQIFSQSPVREVSRNVQLPDLIDQRKGYGPNFQNMLSPLPERSHEAMTSKTVRGLDSEATAYLSGLKNTFAIQEHQDLDHRIKKLQNKTFQKKAIASIESIKNFQLITMTNFENAQNQHNHGYRHDKTPERVLRTIKKKNKAEDETIRVLRAQLSQDNSQDLLESTNQISQEILKQVLTNNNSKISITFDDRGARIQKQSPSPPPNHDNSKSSQMIQQATFANAYPPNDSDNPTNDHSAEMAFGNHWSYTNPKTFELANQGGLQNCKPIISVIPGNIDPNLPKDISRHKEFQTQNLSPGKNLAKIKQNIIDTSLQAPYNAKRSTLLNVDKISNEDGSQLLKKSMLPEIRVAKKQGQERDENGPRESQVYSN